jgi:hypothetical protein
MQLAWLEPLAQGLHIIHWSNFELARQAVRQGLAPSISPRTVRQSLHDVDLQPHRTRYWRSFSLDEQFKERAEKILWCYGNAPALAAQELWVVCGAMPERTIQMSRARAHNTEAGSPLAWGKSKWTTRSSAGLGGCLQKA